MGCCRAWADHVRHVTTAVRLDTPLTARGAACLNNFTHLQHLATTAIHHTHFISRLTRLMSITLKVASLQITDLFPLQALPKLQLLKLHGILIHAVEPILALTQLQHLVLEQSCFVSERHDGVRFQNGPWQLDPADQQDQCSRLSRLDLRKDQTGSAAYEWPAVPLRPAWNDMGMRLAALLLNVGDHAVLFTGQSDTCSSCRPTPDMPQSQHKTC